MNGVITNIMVFFIENTPPLRVILSAGPVCLLWAFLCLHLAGYLKRHRGWRTGYTRKVFHFLIFGSVASIHYVWGTPIVCLFGGMTSLVVFWAVIQGEGSLLYEAMAREKDAPHRTYFIIAPYFATLIGGIASNMIFGNLAVFGYLVGGLGDAIGEPVGTRFGRHTYRVPSLVGVSSVRSYEGSAAVFVVCCLALILGLAASHMPVAALRNLVLVPVLALACAFAEAISPHGWDNATLQILPSMVMSMLN